VGKLKQMDPNSWLQPCLLSHEMVRFCMQNDALGTEVSLFDYKALTGEVFCSSVITYTKFEIYEIFIGKQQYIV